jgi:low temperature requirement protein LtrA
MNAQPVEPERRTSPVELLWDLVFVFAVTQVTTLLSHDLSWAGLGRGMLVLALVWWAWSAFVWVTNAHDPADPRVRAVLFAAMLLTFLVALAVPGAFGDDATLFVLAYAGVRFLHLGLYVDAARKGKASMQAIAGFSGTVTVGMALLVVGSQVGDPWRTILWTAAAAIDYAGPAWLTRKQLAALQRVAVAHFAERYSLFIIICLGESVVATGLATSGHRLDVAIVAGAALTLLVSVGLWCAYFVRVAQDAEEALRTHKVPVLAAADGYSYLHLLLVAGIIVFAVGAKDTVADAADPLSGAARLALCGGVALYLAGHVAFGLRMLGRVSVEQGLGAVACLVVFAVAGGLPAWGTAGLIAAVLALLAARETTEVARRDAVEGG